MRNMQSDYSYNYTASAVLDMLQNLGRYLPLSGGMRTDVTYLTAEQCYHLYKFLRPYAGSFKRYQPLLKELQSAASLK